MYISVTTSAAEETVLHIFKRRMGLTKRGSSHNEALTVSNVSVNQTDHFTVHETSEFVTLIIPAVQILQTKVSEWRLVGLVSKPEINHHGGTFCVMQLGRFLTLC